MTVQLIQHMGDDDTVVDAARVSFNKKAGNFNEAANKRLINYLASHGHWTPFAHAMAQFRIQTSILVARQLHKHQAGLVINEVSRRYVTYEPSFAHFDWREFAPEKKQGSGGPLSDDAALSASQILTRVYKEALRSYNDLLKLGVAPEQARAILPLATHTEWIWTGSLYAWSRVCRLRLADDAQKETAQEAEEIAKHMARLFPVSWTALTNPTARPDQPVAS